MMFTQPTYVASTRRPPRTGPSFKARMRQVLTAVVGSVCILGASAGTAAETEAYPDTSRPIKFIVPTGAGSALDLLARAYGQALANVAGLNTVVENKPGAEGVIGIRQFLSEPANGYSMTLLSSSMVALAPIMIPNLPYDPLTDLEPLTTISTAGLVMSLGTSTEFATLRELVEDARKHPNKYTCATTSQTLRMACEYLQASAGIELLLVPYKTTAEAMAGVASGTVDIIFVDGGSSLAMWKTGRMRPVGVATEQRLTALPDIPTMREEGLNDFLMTAWYATFFQKGTPEPIVKKMRDIMKQAAEDPGVKAALKTFVHEQMVLVGEDVREKNRKEIELWQGIVAKNNLKFGQ